MIKQACQACCNAVKSLSRYCRYGKVFLAKRSRKLFTLSAFTMHVQIYRGRAVGDLVQDAELARDYWDSVAKQFPSWIQVRDGLYFQ